MLINSGVSDRTIARVSGVSRTTIQVILRGRNNRGGQTNKTTTRGVAQRILAVTPTMDILPDLAKIDATGTCRRLQALVALGWPQNHLGEQLNISASNFKTLLSQTRVTVVKARKVRDLYDRLWDTVPMADNKNQATAIKRARKMAATRGWLPPLAWDDESIDDPSAEPETGDATKKGQALVEDVDFLVRTGATADEIAQRTGKAWGSIERQLHRYDRSDLIAAAKNDQRDNARRARKVGAA